ncbi:hypothetical protein ACTRXD_02525 [Nitrospira sp. T9]|uniref:hypothetical protein n=1 Tax=unclassified Nitrospira TaxID=2652172 RepID=UPI003F968493
MYIAPGYEDADWKKLELDHGTSSDWPKAINIFEARIKGRYLDPSNMLIAAEEEIMPTNRRFGFTILAIDCLLIETLQAFIEGKKHTKNKSKEMFQNFLTTRQSFSKYFNQQLADRFFYDYRCGILHQTEIPRESLVWSVGPLMELNGPRMAINRTEFHEALKLEFASYLTDLRNPQNVNLRKHFRNKMDYICQ